MPALDKEDPQDLQSEKRLKSLALRGTEIRGFGSSAKFGAGFIGNDWTNLSGKRVWEVNFPDVHQKFEMESKDVLKAIEAHRLYKEQAMQDLKCDEEV